MYKVYGIKTSGNNYKARLILALINEPYEWEEIPSTLIAPRTSEFMAINPKGKTPVLILHDGTILTESNAILFYLADGTQYLPTDRLERAQVVEWMCFEQFTHEPNIAPTRGIVKNPGHPREGELPRLHREGYKALDVMENHLATREYIVGSQYSVADIALYAYTHIASEGGFDLGRFPAINRWIDRIAGQPGMIPITTPPPSSN